MLDDDIQYVQTRDGIKHMTFTRPTHLDASPDATQVAHSAETNQARTEKP
jgi:hypothetical protein